MARHLRVFVLSLGLLLALTAPALAQTITASLSATRTSGFAPLAVFFDSSGSTHSGGKNSFHELSHAWDFGDPNAGFWAFSGKEKNEALGPLAAHVFEKPGTYVVRVTVKDNAGVVQTKTVNVTVSDPVALATYCFSTTSDFTGCPVSTNRITTNDFDSAVNNYARTNRRLMFRRGQTFSADATADVGSAGPGMIEAFGSGTKPIISCVSPCEHAISVDGQDWRLVDLDFRGRGTAAPTSYYHVNDMCATNTLALRVDMRDFGYHLLCDPGARPYPHFENVFLVEGRWQNATDYGVYAGGVRWALLGVDFAGAGTQHVVRFAVLQRSVIEHNQFQGPTPKHLLKLHAGGNTAGCISTNTAYEDSNYVIISYNRSIGDEVWDFSIEPENPDCDERVTNLIIESNFMSAGVNGGSPLHLSVVDSTIRNNIIDISAPAVGGQCIDVEKRGIEPAPSGNRFYNNTCYRSGDQWAWAIQLSSGGSGNTAFNNILYAPRSTLGDVLGGITGNNNKKVTSNPFVSSSPTNAADFRLNPQASVASQVVDAGFDGGLAAADYDGQSRPADGDLNGISRWDIGAYEVPGIGVPLPPLLLAP